MNRLLLSVSRRELRGHERVGVLAVVEAAHEFGSFFTGQVTASGRNRLYKQHERARTRLLGALPAWIEARRLDATLDQVLRRLAATELASRVTRGAGA